MKDEKRYNVVLSHSDIEMVCLALFELAHVDGVDSECAIKLYSRIAKSRIVDNVVMNPDGLGE